jgi:hypothetical protein
LEIEETSRNTSGMMRSHLMAIWVGWQTKAAEIVLQLVVYLLQDRRTPKPRTPPRLFPSTPPLRDEEACRATPVFGEEQPTRALLMESSALMHLVTFGFGQESTATRTRIASEH